MANRTWDAIALYIIINGTRKRNSTWSTTNFDGQVGGVTRENNNGFSYQTSEGKKVQNRVHKVLSSTSSVQWSQMVKTVSQKDGDVNINGIKRFTKKVLPKFIDYYCYYYLSACEERAVILRNLEYAFYYYCNVTTCRSIKWFPRHKADRKE